MHTETTALSGVIIIKPDVFTDERGEFFEAFQKKRYEELGIPPFVQDNFSVSKMGVLRGLHYQAPPSGQGKLVQVLYGKVIDVALDIRFGSPTFGKYVMLELSDKNKKQLWIPAGFAHGIVSLAEGTVFQYKCTGYYSEEDARGVLFNDPALGINWQVTDLIVNERDRAFPLLKDIEQDFTF